MRRSSLQTEGYDAERDALSPGPVIIVPAQFFDGSPGRNVPTGIRRLMVAILADAIDVYRKHRGAMLRDKHRLHLAARRWFMSEDRTFVFSFLRITEALGIDADLLRKRLRVPRSTFIPPLLPHRLTPLGTRSIGCRASSN